MKKYAILLVDWVSLGQKPEHIKDIKTDIDGLKEELLKLQKGYCVKGEESPTILTKVFNTNIETLCAMSESDFSYISPVKRVTTLIH